MSTSNVSRARQYLQAVASGESFEKVLDFYTPDVVIQEFPNRVAPHGRIRRAADIRPAYEQGRQILQSQTYNVQRILESGDDVARVGVDRNPGSSSDEPARGERNESFRRNVSHLSRRQNCLAKKLRLLSATRVVTERSGSPDAH